MDDKPKYSFDDIDVLKRKPEIEAGGMRVGFPPGNDGTKRWMMIRAATSNNPYWRAQQDRIQAQIKAFGIAKADDAVVRAYLAEKYAELLIRDWGGWKSGGVELPYSKEACTALLIEADDAWRIVAGMVYNDENFRTEEVNAVTEQGKA